MTFPHIMAALLLLLLQTASASYSDLEKKTAIELKSSIAGLSPRAQIEELIQQSEVVLNSTAADAQKDSFLRIVQSLQIVGAPFLETLRAFHGPVAWDFDTVYSSFEKNKTAFGIYQLFEYKLEELKVKGVGKLSKLFGLAAELEKYSIIPGGYTGNIEPIRVFPISAINEFSWKNASASETAVMFFICLVAISVALVTCWVFVRLYHSRRTREPSSLVASKSE